MKILTNKQVVDIMTKYDGLRIQNNIYKAEIEKLERENKQLKKDLTDLQNFCMNFASQNLDFPNSNKSYEDKLF